MTLSNQIELQNQNFVKNQKHIKININMYGVITFETSLHIFLSVEIKKLSILYYMV